MSGIARIRPLTARIAGTSISDLRLSDAIASYRVFAGVDFAMNDGVSFGIQLRWTGHREFEYEAEYTQYEARIVRGTGLRRAVPCRDRRAGRGSEWLSASNGSSRDRAPDTAFAVLGRR